MKVPPAFWPTHGRGCKDDVECYSCSGCAGSVPMIEAVWLTRADADEPSPFCCSECFRVNGLDTTPLQPMNVDADRVAGIVMSMADGWAKQFGLPARTIFLERIASKINQLRRQL